MLYKVLFEFVDDVRRSIKNPLLRMFVVGALATLFIVGAFGLLIGGIVLAFKGHKLLGLLMLFVFFSLLLGAWIDGEL